MNRIALRIGQLVAAVAAVGLGSGCAEPLKAAQNLEGPRVLGVRVSAAGDEASLEPGQPASIELLLAGEAGPFSARVAYQLCEAADSMRGVPYCVAAPFASDVQDTSQPIAVDVPEALAGATRVSLRGVACLSGEPALVGDEPQSWACSDDGEPLRFSFDARPASADFTNYNPDLAQLRVKLGDVDVPLDDPATAPTCDAGAPTLDRDQQLTLTLALGDGAREAGEALQLSHFSTGGVFERQYSFVASDHAPSASIGFRTPSHQSAAKQFVVIRDGRGGVSWASWSFCVR